MQKVKFGEVIRRANSIVDKDNTDLKYYVGGEHFDSGEIFLKRKGTIEGSTIGPMFYFGFKKGQALVVSRNPHLRKASVVDFDGICSEKTFVLETIDSKILLQEYLPFIIQSDAFWQYAEENKSGSVNYFVNWSTFANYEFELPDLDKQRELAELLWAAEEIKHSYQNLIEKSEILLEANFQKMLLEIPYKERSLDDLSSSWLKGQPFKKTEIVDEGENSCIHYGELFTTYGPIIDSIISKTNSEIKCASKVGDILFPASDVTPNGLARCSTIELKNVLLGGDIIIMRPKTSEINTKYLSYAINAQKEQLLSRVTGSLVRHISAKSLKSVIVPIPAQNIQDQFVDFAEKLEISKKSIVPALTNVKAVIKSIINQKKIKEVSHV